MRMRLPKPRDHSTAKQCRQIGIKVGDTIIGRETYSNGHWSEAKLTLLFAGKDEAVWKVMRRSHDKPHWRSTGEQSNWTLECREWWLVVPNVKVSGASQLAGEASDSTAGLGGTDLEG